MGGTFIGSCISVDKLSSTMTKELVASNVDFIASNGILSHNLGLLWGGKLDASKSVFGHSVTRIDIFESLILSDVIIIWNVDTKWAAVSSAANDLKSCKVWS